MDGHNTILEPNLCFLHRTDRDFVPKMIWPFWQIDSQDYTKNNDYLCGFIELDSDTFPGTKIVSDNRYIFDCAAQTYKDENNPPGFSLGIKEFWNAFSTSSEIIFADNFFAPLNYRRMMLELDRIKKTQQGAKNKKINIYSKNNINVLISCANDLMHKYQEIYSMCNIAIGKLPGDALEIHDRFAIMDTEIWHCGATVGGMHRALNAVTRGFRDNDELLKKFFTDKGEIIREY